MNVRYQNNGDVRDLENSKAASRGSAIVAKPKKADNTSLSNNEKLVCICFIVRCDFMLLNDHR